MPKPSSGRKTSREKDITMLRYKEFSAEPITEFTYNGDGGETTRWFEDNSNFRERLAVMTEQDKFALIEYTTGYFMNGQQYKGFSLMTSVEQKYVRTYDRILDKSVVNANVTLTRFSTPELLLGKGRTTATLEELRAMRGKVIASKANLSTAAAKTGLSIGSRVDKKVEYKIHIPAGSKGAGMYIGVDGFHAWGAEQREFLLNRDTVWLVGNTRYNQKRKVYEVDLYFQRQLPHDYS